MNKEIHFDDFGHLVALDSQNHNVSANKEMRFDESGRFIAPDLRDRKVYVKTPIRQPQKELITDALLGTATGIVSALLYDAVKTNMLAKAQEKSQVGPTIFDDPLMRFEQFRGSELPSDIDAMRSLFGS